ncbi:putative tellurium resistance membrane protein TerC [Flavobacterium sp. CG_9.1]|jgi:predicted tellurium resistance membrane protein TerC|uniref:Membrane protein TerC, possibly involved in tellurium resistance n=1 Tax=Flavobacterium xanthum TaxID=69322 RepID=A0A1M6Z2T3_9FLAO|nr:MULTISPECIES: TerC family protein [Flavobacterium]MBG6061202.1 putative tellurium resistance membrane protein TerC [Flavobacterium sp. CG_9.1]SHL24831.1 Membrane protein TerC, possibly involved in tellurium resistance [Flavobacterium xanthum]
MEVFLNPDAWVALLTLTFLEIILGIDNIIFISIVTGKLPPEKRKKATQIGLFLAMFMRIALLFGITLLIKMKEPLFSFDWGWFSAHFNGQALILLGGGIFLIYKSTKEIHEKVDHKGEEEKELKTSAAKSFGNVIFQILLIDLIFSVDSILTAVGMTNGLEGALYIMVTAVVISVGVMMLFAVPVGTFVNNNPSIQILGLAFLILIGFMLITESMHLSEAVLVGQTVGAVPKAYLYFAIAFSLGVEFLNMKMRKKKK